MQGWIGMISDVIVFALAYFALLVFLRHKYGLTDADMLWASVLGCAVIVFGLLLILV